MVSRRPSAPACWPRLIRWATDRTFSARQLVQRRTTILGVVVGDLGNPFHAEMAKQVERHASARGYRTMFCNTQAEETAELAGIQSLLEYRVAGILFLAHTGCFLQRTRTDRRCGTSGLRYMQRRLGRCRVR